MTTPTTTPQVVDVAQLRKLLEQEAEAAKKVTDYKRTAEQWKVRRDRTRQAIIAAMGGAPKGVIDGEEVVTVGRRDQFAHARFISENPDLAKLYMRERTEAYLDVEALNLLEPELAAQYWGTTFTNKLQAA